MLKKILIVNDTADMGVSYTNFFSHFGEVTNDIWEENLSLIVFTGGSDVNPSLYGELAHENCHFNTHRDTVETEIFTKATINHIPMFGICRGAQFLCVMTGGKLVQHCKGHHRTHPILLEDGRIFDVSSSHHQMMIPAEGDKVIGWADPKKSLRYFGGNGEILNYNKEVEVVEFHSVKAYGVQYHPEVMGEDTKGFNYSRELVRKLL